MDVLLVSLVFSGAFLAIIVSALWGFVVRFEKRCDKAVAAVVRAHESAGKITVDVEVNSIAAEATLLRMQKICEDIVAVGGFEIPKVRAARKPKGGGK